MNKKLGTSIGVIVIVLAIIVSYFIFLSDSSTPSIIQQKKETSKEPIELILNVNDLPSGYKEGSREPRFKSEMAQRALDWGWEDGYFASFSKSNDGEMSITWIKQYISIYPLENISKLKVFPLEGEGITIEEIEIENIGDESRAFYIVDENNFADSFGYYRIQFRKKNVRELIIMTGNVKNFEVLKEFVRNAEKKI